MTLEQEAPPHGTPGFPKMSKTLSPTRSTGVSGTCCYDDDVRALVREARFAIESSKNHAVGFLVEVVATSKRKWLCEETFCNCKFGQHFLQQKFEGLCSSIGSNWKSYFMAGYPCLDRKENSAQLLFIAI